MFKILIVEDDKELRHLFQSVLIKNGYNVKVVSNGKEALDVIDNNYFDLIMRYKNGLEEWEGIFADIDGDGDCEIEIDRKTFCNVYTDKTLVELAEFLLDSKNLKEVS